MATRLPRAIYPQPAQYGFDVLHDPDREGDCRPGEEGASPQWGPAWCHTPVHLFPVCPGTVIADDGEVVCGCSRG